jgi:hypothetical protein
MAKEYTFHLEPFTEFVVSQPTFVTYISKFWCSYEARDTCYSISCNFFSTSLINVT